MNNIGEKPLIEKIFQRSDVIERATKTVLLKAQGLTQKEIAEKLEIAQSTVSQYLKKIRATGAVLTYKNVEQMSEEYRVRKELLVKKLFRLIAEAETNGEIGTVATLIRTLNQTLDSEADAFWRTTKKEEVSEESPLSLTRQWISRGIPPDSEKVVTELIKQKKEIERGTNQDYIDIKGWDDERFEALGIDSEKAKEYRKRGKIYFRYGD